MGSSCNRIGYANRPEITYGIIVLLSLTSSYFLSEYVSLVDDFIGLFVSLINYYYGMFHICFWLLMCFRFLIWIRFNSKCISYLLYFFFSK